MSPISFLLEWLCKVRIYRLFKEHKLLAIKDLRKNNIEWHYLQVTVSNVWTFYYFNFLKVQ